MVYISNATEIGTVYTKAELSSIRRICDEYGLYLFMDGARLGSALMASDNDLKLSDIAALYDQASWRNAGERKAVGHTIL